jgi:glycosyltransferase involved in cell wall biosynthesis
VSRPAVTVVITSYQQQDVIRATVLSALGQTLPDVEVVVVDDGSTDASQQVLADLPRVRLLRQPNAGMGSARNTGAEAAQGEVLCFLDGDDLLHPEALRHGLQHLDAAGADFCFGRSRLVDAAGRPLPTVVRPPVRGDLYRELLRHPWVTPPSTMLVRRRVFEAVGRWDPRLLDASDLDLYLRLARRTSGVDHDEVVVDYRLHSRMRSAAYAVVLADNLRVLEQQAEHTRLDPALERARLEGMEHYRRQYGRKIAVVEWRHAVTARRGVVPATRALARVLAADRAGSLRFAAGALTRAALRRSRSRRPR